MRLPFARCLGQRSALQLDSYTRHRLRRLLLFQSQGAVCSPSPTQRHPHHATDERRQHVLLWQLLHACCCRCRCRAPLLLKRGCVVDAEAPPAQLQRGCPVAPHCEGMQQDLARCGARVCAGTIGFFSLRFWGPIPGVADTTGATPTPTFLRFRVRPLE